MGFSFSKRYYSNLFAKGHSMSSEIWGRGSFEQFLWGGLGKHVKVDSVQAGRHQEEICSGFSNSHK